MNPRRLIIWSIVATGVSTVSAQLLIIREFLSQFQGNEITISLVLFSWLLLTGVGSLAAKAVRRPSPTVYFLLLVLIAAGPLFLLLVIRGVRESLFIHGASPGFYPIFFYILATLTPYCFLSGFILPYAQKLLKAQHFSFNTGELYLTDSMGDIAGGILFSFILVYWLKPFRTIALISVLAVCAGLILLVKGRKFLLLGVSVPLLILFYAFASNTSLERATLVPQYGRILKYLESPYGRMVISREETQHTFWESGLPLYSDADVIRSEEKVHYPLCQVDRVKNVLLVSGGLGETLKEVSKYHPLHVDYVELDPYLTRAALDLGVLEKAPSLEIINTDGRQFMKSTGKKYDAVIIDLPDPDTFQINRFFTREFFSLAKGILTRDGVLSLSMEYSPNYISDIRRRKLSILYNTARLNFKNALILPGEAEAYFIFRDGELQWDVPGRLKSKGIKTSYVEGFFYGNVTPERIRELEESLDRGAPVNEDFRPRLMHTVFQEWFTKHGTSPTYFFLVLLGLTAAYLIFLKKEEYVLFTTGMAAMGVEMLVVFAFQVLYGYIYLKIGAVVSVFLLGLLPGALAGQSWRRRESFKLFLSEGLLVFLLLLFLLWIFFFKGDLPSFFFLSYCFAFSFLCGFQFPVVARLMGEESSPAAGCFAADLTGAAVGALVTGALLIPLWGMQAAVIFLILVKISSSMVMGLGVHGQTARSPSV